MVSCTPELYLEAAILPLKKSTYSAMVFNKNNDINQPPVPAQVYALQKTELRTLCSYYNPQCISSGIERKLIKYV